MSDISIDVDYLAAAPLKTIMRFAEQKKTWTKNSEKLQAWLREFQGLVVELENLDIEPKFDLSYGTADIAFAGDGDKLGAVWAILRRHGYVPTDRPQKGATSFNCFWENGDRPRVWMQFTSTMCRRIQTGTKMVETPIYEVVCGDLPELGAPTASEVVECPF